MTDDPYSTEPTKAGLRRSAATGVAWTLGQKLLTRALEAVTFLLLARLLDPRDFGLVAFCAVFLSLLQLLVNQGFSRALIQRRELTKSHLDTSFLLSVLTGATLMVGLAAAAGVLAKAVDRPALVPVLLALSGTLLIGALRSTPEAVLSRRLAFRALTTRSITSSVLASVTGVSLALLGAGVWALVGQALVETAVATVLVWVYSGWRPGIEWSAGAFRDLFGYSHRVLTVNVLNWINRRADDFLIGFFLGPAALGLYSVAYRLLLIMTDSLVAAVDRVAFPVFSRLQGEPSRLRSGYLSATKASVSMAIPAFTMAALLAPALIPALFGDRWAEAVPVMQILALIGILHSFLYFNSTVLLALGQTKLVLRITAVNALVNVVAFAVAVRFGIVAVALAYVIRGYALAPLAIWATKRHVGFGLGDLWRAVKGPILSALLMTLAMKGIFAIAQGHVAVLLVAPLAGIVTYALGVIAFDRESARMLRGIMVRRKSSVVQTEASPVTAGSELREC